MNLETWIKTATENLVPKAAQKVREDIGFHVETAVNRYQLERHSEVEAMELALNDLGDAKVATRGFEKAYLTVQEFDKFTIEKENAHSYIWYGISILFFSFLMLFLYSVRETAPFLKSSHWSLSGAIPIFGGSIYLIMIGHIARKNSLYSYIGSRIVLSITFVSILFLFLNLNLKIDLTYILSNVYQIGFTIWRMFVLRIDYLNWRKLRFL